MNNESTPDDAVVRVGRIEVVDADGKLRAVLGEVSRPTYDASSFGLALFDAEGRRRLRLAVDDAGPVLVLDQGGNIGVELGVHDPELDAIHTGAYLLVADADGTEVAGWRVEADGSVTPYSGE